MRAIAKLVVATTLLTPGCASAPAGASSGEADFITREQLASSSTLSLYEVVERLRPDWLTSRGPTSLTDPTRSQLPSVYFNGLRMGDATALRQMTVTDTEEIRYWRPGEAAARFGMGHPRGVIEVVPRTLIE